LTAQFDHCLTASPQAVVSDGYWIMLTPLPVGDHTITHTTMFGTTTLQTTIHVRVAPRG